MSNLKKYLIQIIITFLTILLLLLVTTTLYYFNIVSPTTYNILKIIFILLALFINSFILGKKATKRGYLEGIKLTIPIIIVFLIITIIKSSFSAKILLYYLILISTSMFGSMVGISRRKEL